MICDLCSKIAIYAPKLFSQAYFLRAFPQIVLSHVLNCSAVQANSNAKPLQNLTSSNSVCTCLYVWMLAFSFLLGFFSDLQWKVSCWKINKLRLTRKKLTSWGNCKLIAIWFDILYYFSGFSSVFIKIKIVDASRDFYK